MLHSERKLRSLLQLGQLIGLDLQLDEMLLQIARKAADVIEADRFSIFLHDPVKNELFTTVALGLGRQVIRMSADSGIAGHCLKTGETVILNDAHSDWRLNREAEAQTGYRTETLLSMAFYSRAGHPLGVTQALNKINGHFTDEDGELLVMLNNHAAVFIEMAQLQKARIEALEQSRSELERLNRAKTKAINHISHELKTPVAIVGGAFRILKQKLQTSLPDAGWQNITGALERNLKRLEEITREASQIFRVTSELGADSVNRELEGLERQLEELAEIPATIKAHWKEIKLWASRYLSGGEESFELVTLYPFIRRSIAKTRARAPHRDIRYEIEGDETLRISMAVRIFREVIDGLLKNAVENTPDGGKITIVLQKKEGKVSVEVKDYGIGITEESRASLFEGLCPARETDLYASKKPYDFGAGGKGLDLLRMRLYAERYGFSVDAESVRCSHIPSERDLCPGKISLCRHCGIADDCLASGGSSFTVAFPLEGQSGDRNPAEDTEVGL